MSSDAGTASRLGRRLHELIFKTNGLSGWVCVGHDDPQNQLRVCLESSGKEVDISGIHAIVALRPLLIAVGSLGADTAILNGGRLRAILRESGTNGRVLGRINLRLHDTIPAGDSQVRLFQTEGGRNLCAPRVRLQLTYLHERWKMSRDRNPRNIHMIPSEAFSLWILHDVPRPVMLVSYGDSARANMFPMDLMGPLHDGWFVLGLHSSSPAVDVWRESGRIVVSSVPLRFKPTVYSMGKNHREPFRDPAKLPIPWTPSKTFGIPAPDAALSVRELRIVTSRDLGSHQLFLTQTEALDIRAREPQMCHVHRFYQQFLMRQNRPLPWI